MYPIHQFAKMIRVTPQTLRNWEKKGTLIPHCKSGNGYRYYTETQYRAFLGGGSDIKKIVIGYCRVSSVKHKDYLERQIEHVRTYMIAKGYSFEVITDIGSGINYNKKGLLEVVERLARQEVSKVVILYKDRLLRFGFERIENFAKMFGAEIEIIDNTEKTEELELEEDLIQIVTVFSCRLQGKSANKAKRMIKELLADDSCIEG
nr:IS607 family transposase [Paenibacillus periandrae]